MNGIGIRALLALTMGGLVLVATAAVLTIALRASATNTFELLNERMVLILDGIEDEVRDRLDAAGDLVDGVARQLQTDRFAGAAPDAILDAMSVALAASPEVAALLYWDRNMMRRGVSREAGGRLERFGATAESDMRIRQALAAIPPGSARQWGTPVSLNGVAYMNVSARAPAGSEAAFVAAAVSLDQFSMTVAHIGRRYGATAFMLYGSEQVLAHPDIASIKDMMKRGYAVIPIAEMRDPVLSNLGRGERASFMDPARSKGVEVLDVTVADQDYIVMSRGLDGYGARPISIGAYYARTEIVDTLRRLAVSGLVGMIVAAIAVVAAIMLGGLIARPVRRLAQSASAVAHLDLAAVERPEPSPVAEVQEQVRAFNIMLDALRVFETYVPRKLVRRLVELGGGGAMPSEMRDMTVMFTDIVGFTGIADRMGAEETANFLNRHFGLLAECIRVENGTIDKYIGDAIMAFWGAPDRMQDHAARGVNAARCMAARLTADNERRARKGLRPVRLRIGLHSGKAVVGNIGAPDRINYTIVGDTVNVAQRIEALGHQYYSGADVTVLMSAETARLAGLAAGEVEDLGVHRLAGVPHDVAVCRLRDGAAAQTAPIAAAMAR